MRRPNSWLITTIVICGQAGAAYAQATELPQSNDYTPAILEQWQGLGPAMLRLALATALGALLAFRFQRPGTPPRQPAVIQTQIILAIVGALVMMIVGASLARAFGIVGVASLIRYRAKVDDPKDAGVMLTTLGVGLCSGVGLYLLAIFSTLFILGVLWWVESLAPRAVKVFHLKVTTPDPGKLRPLLEQALRKHKAKFEQRTMGANTLAYEVKLPLNRRTDVISNQIVTLANSSDTLVEWGEKKNK
jgi:uncharacterized membrane protein YhiD involved in acid resistance